LRPWTRDAAISFLRTPVEVRALIEAAGCWVRAWEDVTAAIAGSGPSADAQAPTIQARVLAAAFRTRIPIVYLKMGFRPDLLDLGPGDSPNRPWHLRFGVGETVRSPDGGESRILIQDSWNTEIVPELAPQANDVVLYKLRFSGFLPDGQRRRGHYSPRRAADCHGAETTGTASS
jgi:hypothetical protein